MRAAFFVDRVLKRSGVFHAGDGVGHAKLLSSLVSRHPMENQPAAEESRDSDWRGSPGSAGAGHRNLGVSCTSVRQSAALAFSTEAD
jgi:hypothetical protein